MSENDQVYQIDSGDDALWSSVVDRVQQDDFYVFVSQAMDVRPEDVVADVEKKPSGSATYFASPTAIAADIDSTQVYWPASFPLLKRQAVVAVPSSIAKSIVRPRSQSDLLLQLAAAEQPVKVVAAPRLGFDWKAGTLPLADSGTPADDAVSEFLSEKSSNMPDIVRSGLLLANGEDEASHRVSQSFEGESDFDYWHGLMHRREPDYGNANYWFRRVGQHPAFDDLPAAIKRIFATISDVSVPSFAEETWSAFDAIDNFRRATDQPGSELERQARLIQQAEIANLLHYIAAP